jgi:hypothetical protein
LDGAERPHSVPQRPAGIACDEGRGGSAAVDVSEHLPQLIDALYVGQIEHRREGFERGVRATIVAWVVVSTAAEN